LRLALTPLWFSHWRLQLGLSTLCVAACVALAAACGSSGASGVKPGTGAAGASSGDAGTDAGDAGPTVTGVAFTSTERVRLAPKQTVQLTVQVSPPGSFPVRFALPGSGGDEDPVDAVLDRAESQSDENGIAHVVLTAPSTPATFSVRAAAGTQSTLRGVVVSTLGYTELRVDRSYSGKRPVAAWTATATARAGVSCSQLVGNPPPDGPQVVTVAPMDQLYLEQVPVGVDVVVTLRAGHYIGGCATLPPLTEGDGNQVLVYASDRPLNLSASQLALAFGPSDARVALDKWLQGSATSAESALVGAATSDVNALLDGMHDATAISDRNAFDAGRVQGNWDAALASAFGKGGARRMRDPAQRWLSAGLAAFDAPDTFSGSLAASGKNALFKLTSVAGLAPSDAGFLSSFPATWSADSSDTMLLGTELSWLPSRLVTALAEAPALLDFPQAVSVEEALAKAVDCELVSHVLLVYGDVAGSSLYAGCDASCAVTTCQSAISTAWQNARAASGTATVSLSVTATGSADVGDAAEVTNLRGSWVGALSDGASNVATSGALSATGQ
jgi:hypothetical protein